MTPLFASVITAARIAQRRCATGDLLGAYEALSEALSIAGHAGKPTTEPLICADCGLPLAACTCRRSER